MNRLRRVSLLAVLLGGCASAGGTAGASRNRCRDLLSGMFKRAMRLGLVSANP
jgi:hypothetical protein